MAKLKASKRNSLPKASFALPGKRAYPIHDRSHAANALARASGKSVYSTVKRKVCARYPSLPACK
jgi:hypothetical protein